MCDLTPSTAQRRGTWVYYRPEPVLMQQLAALLAVPADSVAG